MVEYLNYLRTHSNHSTQNNGIWAVRMNPGSRRIRVMRGIRVHKGIRVHRVIRVRPFIQTATKNHKSSHINTDLRVQTLAITK